MATGGPFNSSACAFRPRGYFPDGPSSTKLLKEEVRSSRAGRSWVVSGHRFLAVTGQDRFFAWMVSYRSRVKIALKFDGKTARCRFGYKRKSLKLENRERTVTGLRFARVLRDRERR